MPANDTSFKPGVSGNPSGRKPDKELRELCRAETVPAFNTLRQVMLSKKASFPARVAAAVAILDRGWGKPPVTLAGEGGEGDAKLIVQVIRFSDGA